ncbi:MAG: NlpC/P60 family protein [Verrucomicrobiota bacterium]
MAVACLLPVSVHGDYASPGQITIHEIEGIETVDEKRVALIQEALEVQQQYLLDQYIYGSADPKLGGFDCSGAIYFILKQVGLQPPRSSDRQFKWLNEHETIHLIPEGVHSLEDQAFSNLKPGDLLFWSGTYNPEHPRVNKITHVEMYLGIEKATGKHIMIGSTSGRYYKGTPRTGYGVFDFKLPSASSSSRFMGYGPPPGLLEP